MYPCASTGRFEANLVDTVRDLVEGVAAVPSRLADLIRRARRLAAERDRLIEALAADWTRALRGQRLSASDLDELWAGLTEEAVRRGGVTGGGQVDDPGVARGGAGGHRPGARQGRGGPP